LEEAAAGGEEVSNDDEDVEEAATESPTPQRAGFFRFVRNTLWDTMRDACVVFVFAMMVTQIVQEAGHSSKRRFVMGVAENLPEAAVPRGLTTRAYSARPEANVGLYDKQTPSYVEDYPKGDVYAAFNEADNHHDVFVMYYALWDADSQHAKHAFQAVAEVFHAAQLGPAAEATAVAPRDVYFASVNCWLPKSDCVKEFNKNGKDRSRDLLQQFPVFVFYPKNRKGVQYNGPITDRHIMQFLESATRPVQHLATYDDWLDLRAAHGGTATAAFLPNLYKSRRSKGQYRKFVSSSYHLMESDPFKAKFGGLGVVTDPRLAFRLKINETSGIPARLTLWNGESVVFPNKTLSSAKLLANWIQSKALKATKIPKATMALVPWIGVAGRKSIRFSSYLKKQYGHSLLVFMPRPASLQFNAQYEALLATAIRYRTCEGSKPASSLLLLLDRLKARYNSSQCRGVMTRCLAQTWFVERYLKTTHQKKSCCDCNGANKFDNVTVVSLPSLRFPEKIVGNRQLDLQQKALAGFSNGQVDTNIRRLQEVSSRMECLLATNCMQSSRGVHLLAPDDESGIDGLGCEGNRTVNFFAVDSETNSHLAKSIGLKLNSNAPTFAIVSLREEAVYRASDDQSLSDFIKSFHEQPSKLERLQVKKDTTAKSECDDVTKSNKEKPSCVKEISGGDDFDRVVMDPKHNVVVLYRTAACAFCSAQATQAFHSVSQIFQSLNLPLKFVAFDAASSDLPWQFTALSVPTILYAPMTSSSSGAANRTKSDTRVFPSSSKALTTANVLNFVIANLNREERLALALSLCSESSVDAASCRRRWVPDGEEASAHKSNEQHRQEL